MLIFFLQATSDIQASGTGILGIILGTLATVLGGGGAWKALGKKFDTDNLKEQITTLKKALEESKTKIIELRKEIKELTGALNEMTSNFDKLVDRIEIYHKVKTEDATLDILINKSDKDGKQ